MQHVEPPSASTARLQFGLASWYHGQPSGFEAAERSRTSWQLGAWEHGARRPCAGLHRAAMGAGSGARTLNHMSICADRMVCGFEPALSAAWRFMRQGIGRGSEVRVREGRGGAIRAKRPGAARKVAGAHVGRGRRRGGAAARFAARGALPAQHATRPGGQRRWRRRRTRPTRCRARVASLQERHVAMPSGGHWTARGCALRAVLVSCGRESRAYRSAPFVTLPMAAQKQLVGASSQADSLAVASRSRPWQASQLPRLAATRNVTEANQRA